MEFFNPSIYFSFNNQSFLQFTHKDKAKNMKREGHQHGMVRTFRILPSPHDPRANARIFNGIDVPPTAGLFTKVPSKPTNHSKFTGKCGRARCSECHLHPACKSKDKTKGSNKIKSFDLASHRMVTWRVVDDRPGLSLSGSSASGLLDHLVDDYGYDDHCRDDDLTRSGLGIILAANDDEDEGPEPADSDAYKNDQDNDEKLDIYEVGFILDHVEEGGWCLVGERHL